MNIFFFFFFRFTHCSYHTQELHPLPKYIVWLARPLTFCLLHPGHPGMFIFVFLYTQSPLFPALLSWGRCFSGAGTFCVCVWDCWPLSVKVASSPMRSVWEKVWVFVLENNIPLKDRTEWNSFIHFLSIFCLFFFGLTKIELSQANLCSSCFVIHTHTRHAFSCQSVCWIWIRFKLIFFYLVWFSVTLHKPENTSICFFSQKHLSDMWKGVGNINFFHSYVTHITMESINKPFVCVHKNWMSIKNVMEKQTAGGFLASGWKCLITCILAHNTLMNSSLCLL